MKKALIIFVRNPELGNVKTRLAATVGAESALEIYKELLQHTYEIALATDADRFVFYVDKIAQADLWETRGFVKRVQAMGDLGGKMKAAFNELFSEGYNNVVIIGSDCLELTTNMIHKAFELLEMNDVVIGPARDGGYYLLGLKKMVAPIFENKQWGTEHVYNDTIAGIENAGLSFATLPVLTDVDTEEDWVRRKKS